MACQLHGHRGTGHSEEIHGHWSPWSGEVMGLLIPKTMVMFEETHGYGSLAMEVDWHGVWSLYIYIFDGKHNRGLDLQMFKTRLKFIKLKIRVSKSMHKSTEKLWHIFP